MKSRFKMIALAVAAMSLTVNTTAHSADYNMQDPQVKVVTVTPKAEVDPRTLRGPVKETLDQRIEKPRKPGSMAPEGWALLGAIVVAAVVGLVIMKNPNKCEAGEAPPACDP